MSLVLCDKGPKAAMLIEAAGRMSSLRTLIVFDGDTLTQDVVDAGLRANIEVFRFEEILVGTHLRRVSLLVDIERLEIENNL